MPDSSLSSVVNISSFSASISGIDAVSVVTGPAVVALCAELYDLVEPKRNAGSIAMRPRTLITMAMEIHQREAPKRISSGYLYCVRSCIC